MRLHVVLAAAAVLCAGGCASAPAVDPTATVVLATQKDNFRAQRAPDGSVQDSLPGAPADALAALKSAYAALGLRLDMYNATAMAIGTQNQRLQHRFDGSALSRFFDCGYQTQGDRADRWYVFVNVVSQLSATPRGALVTTRIAASAQDPGAGNTRLPCASTGVLESRIVALTRSKLGT